LCNILLGSSGEDPSMNANQQAEGLPQQAL
jgi:hypothetical protein